MWAAFLLTILRDLVPRFSSTFRGEESVSYVNDIEFDNMTRTSVFRLACSACNLDHTYVRSRLDEIRNLTPSEEFKEFHRKAYPKGGVSHLIRVHQYYIEDFIS